MKAINTLFLMMIELHSLSFYHCIVFLQPFLTSHVTRSLRQRKFLLEVTFCRKIVQYLVNNLSNVELIAYSQCASTVCKMQEVIRIVVLIIYIPARVLGRSNSKQKKKKTQQSHFVSAATQKVRFVPHPCLHTTTFRDQRNMQPAHRNEFKNTLCKCDRSRMESSEIL